MKTEGSTSKTNHSARRDEEDNALQIATSLANMPRSGIPDDLMVWLLDNVKRSVDDFIGSALQFDDLTMLAVMLE